MTLKGVGTCGLVVSNRMAGKKNNVLTWYAHLPAHITREREREACYVKESVTILPVCGALNVLSRDMPEA